MGVFDKAKRKINTLAALNKLASGLQKLGDMPNFNPDNNKAIYDYAIKYFNLIATFQDKNSIIADDFKGNAKEIKTIIEHISNSGRDPYGWVRAEPGKPVTLANLYLGNVSGIWTRTAAEFQNNKDPQVQAIIYDQVSKFIKSHYMPLIKNINTVVNKQSQGLDVRIISKIMPTKSL